jgi:hypothetical protein
MIAYVECLPINESGKNTFILKVVVLQNICVCKCDPFIEEPGSVDETSGRNQSVDRLHA